MKPNHNFDAIKLPTVNRFQAIGNKLFQTIILFIIFILLLFVFSALANIVWKGLGGFIQSIASPEIQFAIRLSVFTSITSTLICIAFALPVAYGLERFKIPGRKLINVVLDIPLSLPPLVSGVALLLLLGTTGFGTLLAERGLSFVFSVNGIILAQFFIITPYMIRILKSTIADINPRLEFVARTLGCSQWQAFYKITLPLAKNGIIAGLVISWARAIGEFGCALMVAGATRMVTETLPVALYLNMSIGNLEMAMASATCLIIISLISLFIFEMVGVQQIPASRIN
ncbi:MAG: ABC transporter permease [Syntrophomonadaceae bacterium]|nr:ABC transporter permease [Syntrophomonadaceae bacterium]MDD3022831.1 ABC transporter permease [Syntrophomonadaceae bacterium]